MAYQSKTYSLSDEVVEAIEAGRADGLSPDRYLWQVIFGEPKPSKRSLQVSVSARAAEQIGAALGVPSTFDTASIPGVSTGPPLNAYCIHCERKFAGAKGANTCIPCGRDGHVTAGNCRRCAEVAHVKKLQASSTGVDDPSIQYDDKGQI